MSVYTYSTILNKAKTIVENVKTKYKTGENAKWGYYFAKAILNPKKDIQVIQINPAENPHGTYISRDIYYTSYIDMCKRLVNYIEKKHQLPNNLKYTTKAKEDYFLNVSLYTYFFALVLVSYATNNKLPDKINITSKAFTKPTENKNTVFTKWVNKFKFTPKYLDDVCDYIIKYFTYLFYYDDHKSNAEVIDTKSGNCTDLLQMLINMAEALGYEWKVIHTQCRQSKVGHVYGMFRRKDVNNGNWFVRDIACIADESRYCVWCEVPSGGNKLAENPSWFLANLRR